MGVGLEVNDVPIVGEPIAYGIGFVALLLVTLTGSWTGALTTVVHEGAHYVVSALSFRRPQYFELEDGGGGGTTVLDQSWGPGYILSVFAGYAAPPLVALGGAALVAAGNAWAVLWSAIVLFLAAFIVAGGPLAFLFTLLVLAGVTWAALAGSAAVQAAVAVGLVWVLLFGSLRSSLILSRADGTDAARLARATLVVPRIVWHAVWVVIALLALVVGGQFLLRPGYTIG